MGHTESVQGGYRVLVGGSFVGQLGVEEEEEERKEGEEDE